MNIPAPSIFARSPNFISAQEKIAEMCRVFAEDYSCEDNIDDAFMEQACGGNIISALRKGEEDAAIGAITCIIRGRFDLETIQVLPWEGSVDNKRVVYGTCPIPEELNDLFLNDLKTVERIALSQFAFARRAHSLERRMKHAVKEGTESIDPLSERITRLQEMYEQMIDMCTNQFAARTTQTAS